MKNQRFIEVIVHQLQVAKPTGNIALIPKVEASVAYLQRRAQQRW
jgi:hypothetical protein